MRDLQGPKQTTAVHTVTHKQGSGAQDGHGEPLSSVRREAPTATMSFQDQRMSRLQETRTLS